MLEGALEIEHLVPRGMVGWSDMGFGSAKLQDSKFLLQFIELNLSTPKYEK